MSHSEQKFFVSSALYGLLALRQHRVNQAAGINRVTSQVSLFLALYNRERAREIAALPPDKKLLTHIYQIKSEINELTQKAKGTTDPKEQREYLASAQQLHVQMIEAVNFLRKWANE